MEPIPLGIPPRTLGYKLPKKPCFPKKLKIILNTAVPTADRIKTKTIAKITDRYIINITIIKMSYTL